MNEIRPLNPELAALAKLHCLEEDALIQSSIISIREWMQRQKYRTRTQSDDQFIIGFLRFCNYSLEKTKKRIDYFYNYKSSMEKSLKGTLQIDEKMLDMCELGMFASLPKPSGGPSGPRIHYTRLSAMNSLNYSIHDILRFQLLRSEIDIRHDDNWVIAGVVEIIDFEDISFSVIRAFHPGLFIKMSNFLDYGVPSNLVATHIVNASKVAQLLLNLIRSLMKEKELMHIHASVDSLQSAIGSEYLPTELGGNNGSLEEAKAKFKEQFLEYQRIYSEESEFEAPHQFTSSVQSLNNPNRASYFKLNIDSI